MEALGCASPHSFRLLDDQDKKRRKNGHPIAVYNNNA